MRRALAWSVSPRAVPRMSRYWPTFSSMRSSFHTASVSGSRSAQHEVGVHVGQVADEDGDALAEPPGLAPPALDVVPRSELEVHGLRAPPGGRAVHHVVVDERERLQQLERSAGVHDPSDRRGRRRRPRSPSSRTRAAAACRPPSPCAPTTRAAARGRATVPATVRSPLRTGRPAAPRRGRRRWRGSVAPGRSGPARSSFPGGCAPSRRIAPAGHRRAARWRSRARHELAHRKDTTAPCLNTDEGGRRWEERSPWHSSDG